MIDLQVTLSNKGCVMHNFKGVKRSFVNNRTRHKSCKNFCWIKKKLDLNRNDCDDDFIFSLIFTHAIRLRGVVFVRIFEHSFAL